MEEADTFLSLVGEDATAIRGFALTTVRKHKPMGERRAEEEREWAGKERSCNYGYIATLLLLPVLHEKWLWEDLSQTDPTVQSGLLNLSALL